MGRLSETGISKMDRQQACINYLNKIKFQAVLRKDRGMNNELCQVSQERGRATGIECWGDGHDTAIKVVELCWKMKQKLP